jgi:hypothetical protein
MYDNARFGNRPLAEALYDLANSLAVHSHESPELSSPPQVISDQREIQELDPEAVERFLSDQSKSKRELIDLAVARFSIPHAALMKMKTADVRETIYTALLNEKSISIIAREAERTGAKRKS